MTNEHPVVDRYLAALDAALAQLRVPERADIVGEIRNHIAETRAGGRSLDAVLGALGPAETLARAYAVELALNPSRGRRVSHAGRMLAVIPTIAAMSLAALVVISSLGALGIGFSTSGLAVFWIGVLEQAGIHLPGVQMNGVPPVVAIVLGPVLLVIGLAALIALWRSVRFFSRTMRRVLPAGADRIRHTATRAY